MKVETFIVYAVHFSVQFLSFCNFNFSVARGSAAIFGHATFQSFQKTEKHDALC